MGIKKFFSDAFSDMKEDAKAQHEVDKANFAAVKAESKANFEEAKAASRPSAHKAAEQKKRDEQICEANKRRAEAEARTEALKK